MNSLQLFINEEYSVEELSLYDPSIFYVVLRQKISLNWIAIASCFGKRRKKCKAPWWKLGEFYSAADKIQKSHHMAMATTDTLMCMCCIGRCLHDSVAQRRWNSTRSHRGGEIPHCVFEIPHSHRGHFLLHYQRMRELNPKKKAKGALGKS